MPIIEDEGYMRRALALASHAAAAKEVPVGALVVHENQVISEAYNSKERANDPLGHAELLAIQSACKKLDRWRLEDCTLYVTLEPCIMCAGAIVQARLSRVVFGALDAKGGGVESLYKILQDPRLNHRPQVEGGVLASECGAILTEFFRQQRASKRI